MMSTPPPVIVNPPLCEDVVLLDGLSRTGKMFSAKLVSNFERVDYFMHSPTLEHIAICWRLGTLTETAAVSLFRMTVDMLTYDRIVGRNLNGRLGDASYIGHATDHAEYLMRAVGPEHADAVDRFKTGGRMPLYLTHELLPQMALLEKALPKHRMIHLTRHPVDVVHSWHRRGWGARFGTDPLAFTPVADIAGEGVPWFAADWAEDYIAMDAMGRCVGSVIALMEACDRMADVLSDDARARLSFVAYEKLTATPETELDRLSGFLGTRPRDNMKAIIARERLPHDPGEAPRQEKRADIEKAVPGDLFRRLADCARAYEDRLAAA